MGTNIKGSLEILYPNKNLNGWKITAVFQRQIL
jgi:hypothetical protein